MTIVVGVDGGASSQEAARVAAKLAGLRGDALQLVAVAPAQAPEALAAELGAEHGTPTEALRLTGSPAPALAGAAADGSLVVLGTEGPRAWGSVAKALVSQAVVPFLSVRQPARLHAWLDGERELQVLVPVLLDEPSAPLAWADALAAGGSVETCLAHVVWPPDEHYRDPSPGPLPLDGLSPATEASLLEDMRRWAPPAPEGVRRTFRVIPGWGRVDGHLSSAAEGLDPDLIVVGARPLGVWERWVVGSVSRKLLAQARWNVAVVPLPASP